MSNNLRYKPWVKYSLYAIGFICIVGLLGIARNYSKHKKVSALNIEIQQNQLSGFITNQDIQKKIKEIYPGITSGAAVHQINTRIVEKVLRNDLWISTAQVFFNRKNELVIKVMPSQPVARVVTTEGKHFYIDTMGKWMPLQYSYASRLPVVTNYPVQQNGTPKNDSVLKMAIIDIGKVCFLDSFWQSQLSQVNVNSNKTLMLTPTLGNHKIYMGAPVQVSQKLLRLKRYYMQYASLHGLQMYDMLDVQYDKQIVAIKRGEKAVTVKDSLGIRTAMGTFDSSQIVPAKPIIIEEVVDGDEVQTNTIQRNTGQTNTVANAQRVPVSQSRRNRTVQTPSTNANRNTRRPQVRVSNAPRPARVLRPQQRINNSQQHRNQTH
jgi:cell division protein FtsQ